MTTSLNKFLTRNRYKIAIFSLMLGASIFSVMLVAARMAYSDSGRYANLVWNLFLAWIPFLLAYAAYTLSWKRTFLYLLIPVFAFLWLIFFPNAPYILTDLQHLAVQSTAAPLWYDVILLIWFSWTGMLLGLISLYLMQEIVRRIFGRWVGWLFVFVMSAASSLGIYMGRFLRWNSWDILQNPSEVAMDVLGFVIDPSLRTLAFTTLFTVFFLFIYLTLYAFGHLLREQVEQTAPHRVK
ncbi:MAG: DUF1361 domain-containing protein [Chloroflexi bacterium]|nr:DUF1361 domain-containing protein [Chloroflexota bacterium]